MNNMKKKLVLFASVAIALASCQTTPKEDYSWIKKGLDVAKTGSFTAINALAGYLKMKNGHEVAFAIMNQNILSAAKARNFQNKVCEILANHQ